MYPRDAEMNHFVFLVASVSGRMVYRCFTWCWEALKLSCARTKEVCMLPCTQYRAYQERNKPEAPVEFIPMSLVYTGWDPILAPSVNPGTPTSQSWGQDTPRSRSKPDRTSRKSIDKDGVRSPKSPSKGTACPDPDPEAIIGPYTHQP